MSDTLSPLLIGKNDTFEAVLLPALGNRHGLITGATGTGKTVTLQRLAEQFSAIGVPVFMADVKGDLTGISQPGQMSPKLQTRLEQHGLPTPQFTGFPVTLWDVYGKQGHPVRATISDMGPLLLSRMLGLNDTQEGVLNLTFKVADDNGLLLLDSKDLRAMLQYVGENAKQFTNQYGNVSSASIGAIQRNLLTLEQQGAERFFGEPMLKLPDMMRTAPDGRGVINILMADQLMNAPKLYGTFLLWLLSELFEQLPEVGDQPKPKMVFFFDEAHLLFDDAPKALLDKIEQVVRLIRSKGVGVYFITQNPLDVPESVLGQLGNRVQHALRAFTPRDQKAVRTAAETMRANPALDTAKAISELGVGEALVSFLDAKGTPGIVERVWIATPASRIGPATPDADFCNHGRPTWFPDISVNVFTLVDTLLLISINFMNVRNYGEFEFWFALIKVTAIVCFIIICLLAVLNIWQGGTVHGIANLTAHGGFMPNGWSSVVVAMLGVMFAFLGAEIVTIAASESANPADQIVKATNSVVWRICLFYIGSIFLIVCLVPWNDPHLGESGYGSYRRTLELLGVPGAQYLMNFVVLTSVSSCLISAHYTASRMLFSLAKRGDAHPIFKQTSTRGIPVYSVIASCSIAVFIAMLNFFDSLRPKDIPDLQARL